MRYTFIFIGILLIISSNISNRAEFYHNRYESDSLILDSLSPKFVIGTRLNKLEYQNCDSKSIVKKVN